jgi:hypothetical protein
MKLFKLHRVLYWILGHVVEPFGDPIASISSLMALENVPWIVSKRPSTLKQIAKSLRSIKSKWMWVTCHFGQLLT